MGPLFAKMDINLDSHPKIRKAGRDGREVFLFVLRKNAALGRGGKIPASYVDPAYLAEQLMVTEAEAVSGLSRCVTADLLFVTGLEVAISGWDDTWGGRSLTEAERKAKQRKRSKESGTSTSESRDVTNVSGHDRDCPESPTVEKRREEKKREGENQTGASAPTSPVPDRVAQIAELAIGEINRIGKHRFDPTSESALKLARNLAKRKRTDEEILLVIRSKKAWVADEKMAEHFCPSTLLGPENFAKYLDKARGARPAGAGPPKLLFPSKSDEPDLSYDPNAA